MRNRHRIIAIAIIACYFSLTVVLALTARPQSDEAVYANPGYNLIATGKMGTTLYPLPDYLPVSTAQRTYIQPPLYFVVTAGLFRIAGFGLMQVRFLSIFFGLVCLLSWFTIVRNLTKSIDAALLVMALISVDYFFLMGASHGRMDMMCIGLGSAGLAVYAHWRETHLIRAVFWGNLLTGLALLTHPTGLVWAAGLLLAMTVIDWRSLSVKLLLLGAIPYLLAAAAWGSYIAQDPAAFREQMKQELIVNEASFDYSHLSHIRAISYLQQEVLTRYLGPYGFLPGVGLASRLKILLLTSYLAAVLGLLFLRRLRRKPHLIWFSLLFISAFFILAEISPSKYYYYLPHTTVMMAACLGVFLFSLFDTPRWSLVLILGVILAAIQLGGVAHVIHLNEYRRTYLPVIDAIQRNTSANTLIMSQGELWFGLWRDHEVLFDTRLGINSGLRPAAFVMDPVFRDLHERDRKLDPRAYEFVEDMIRRYRLVYQDGYSEVYAANLPTAALR